MASSMANNFLHTQWSFVRTIEDLFYHTTMVAQGTLSITDSTWREDGMMQNTTGLNPFYQEYGLSYDKYGLHITFNDGREFYSISSPVGTHNIEHLCGDDLYSGTWSGTSTTISLEWFVKGPKKNYTIQSQYTLQL